MSRQHPTSASALLDALFGSRTAVSERRTLAIRHRLHAEPLLGAFVVASLPVALIGAWRVGGRVLSGADDATSSTGWPVVVTHALGLDSMAASTPAALLAGLTVLACLLLITVVIAAGWELLFAHLRGRAADPGWLPGAWLFVLLIPSDVPLLLLLPAVSFGVVFGQHLFGGSGRYLVSPALLGALFLQVAYPAAGAAGSSFTQAATAAGDPGSDVLLLLLGGSAEHFAGGSALACAIGALYLVWRGVASHRTLTGALLGITITLALAGLSGEPASLLQHLTLGGMAFGWAFLLTDPTTLPLTRVARWLHGALFGVLLVVMREGDPGHPDGTLFAILLAGLFVPLIDWLVLRLRSGAGSGQLGLSR